MAAVVEVGMRKQDPSQFDLADGIWGPGPFPYIDIGDLKIVPVNAADRWQQAGREHIQETTTGARDQVFLKILVAQVEVDPKIEEDANPTILQQNLVAADCLCTVEDRELHHALADC